MSNAPKEVFTSNTHLQITDTNIGKPYDEGTDDREKGLKSALEYLKKYEFEAVGVCRHVTMSVTDDFRFNLFRGNFMIWIKLELGLLAESELKAGMGVKSRKEPESESKAGPGLKLRTGLGLKTSVETKSKLKV
ncbi:hypothetical protein EVAR_41633_1 [Eumeta japonica]|uniref:Uncharacterized protein n=1 Tax=Eumeta variegata TaxID=151549 RepID=A0A4C1X3F5_EUMVA|nr:hypothetical protein EVAR_41633_1 [Eumeta japonica]